MATQTTSPLQTDRYPLRRPSLGKRFTSWTKKGPKGHSHFTNSQRHPTEFEAVEVHGTQEFFIGDRILEIGTMNDENRAVLWLGKLLHKKKYKKSSSGDQESLGRNQVRVMTLAEQLAEAHATDLDGHEVKRMEEVLRNPSRAKKFFQRLSRTPAPTEYDEPETAFNFSSGSKDGGPIIYVRHPDRDLSDLTKEREQVLAELASLERQMAELGQTTPRAPQQSFGKFCNDLEVRTNSQLSLPPSRPQPSLERISFFPYWWGYEIAIPKSKMQNLQGAKQAMEVFIEFVTLLAPPQIKIIKPLVTIVTEYLRTNYQIALMQDNGKGVILAATWLLPVLIIPRAWDYPESEVSTLNFNTKNKGIPLKEDSSLM